MATRDLTDHFIRQRSALHRKVGGNFGGGGDGVGGTGLLGSSGGAQIDTSALSVSGASPVYVETVNELQADFQGIATRCECLCIIGLHSWTLRVAAWKRTVTLVTLLIFFLLG